MTLLIVLGVLVFLLHAGICGYIIGLIADAMRPMIYPLITL